MSRGDDITRELAPVADPDRPLVAFLPWEADQQRTPCGETEARKVATALSRANPGKAVHVVRAEHVELDPAERPVVWDTYCAPNQEAPADGDA